MFFENDEFLRSKRRPILKHYPPSEREIHRPIAVTRFLGAQQPDLLVGLCYQLRAKEVTRTLGQLLVAELSQKLQSVHFVFAANHSFDKT